jgi:hypothetical protein
MKKWTTFTLPPPACVYGYAEAQVREITEASRELTGRGYDDFNKWFVGQTGALCSGKQPCREAHGPVVYPWDLRQFLRGGPDVLSLVRERTRDN